MNAALRDRLAGAVLLLVAIAWIAGVYWTIPGDPGGSRIGPRGFPLAMGLGLAFLSLLLIAAGFLGTTNDPLVPDDPEARRKETRVELWAVASTFGFVIVYTLVLDWLGFVLGTILVTAGFLRFALNKRSPVLVAGLPVGLSLGAWFVMGQLIGVYLPKGTLFSAF